ncbi:FkbM family methyltransferase [Arcticibacter sp. MXS-1]|uniref:FkbM family methyltransferase n=1 Tax=Arcticibacter sp. MXS-1 TaxID=3341726 RepID=UPI0035A8C438
MKPTTPSKKNILKEYVKRALNKLPKKIRHRINKAVALSLGYDQAPTFNMFYHVRILKELGFIPEVVIDIGAYQGEWTKNVLDIFPNSYFLMIEAQTSKKPILEEICQEHKNVSFESCLLGQTQQKEVSFYEMETGSSIYQENTSHSRRKVHLDMTTLDLVATKKHTISKKCFLKIDVQGAELDVLAGAGAVLETCEFVLLEVSMLNYNENAPQFADVILFLKEKGFVLFDICDIQRNTHDVAFQTDLLFIKESSSIRSRVNFQPTAGNTLEGY